MNEQIINKVEFLIMQKLNLLIQLDLDRYLFIKIAIYSSDLI